MQTKKITTLEELRTDLLEAYESLKADPRRINQVSELSNTAGKIIASVKVEMEYAALRGEKPDIKFIGPTTGEKLIGNGKSK